MTYLPEKANPISVSESIVWIHRQVEVKVFSLLCGVGDNIWFFGNRMSPVGSLFNQMGAFNAAFHVRLSVSRLPVVHLQVDDQFTK